MLNSDSGGLIHEVPEAIRNWARDDQCYALGDNLVVFCLFHENSTETKFKSYVNVLQKKSQDRISFGLCYMY